MILDTIVDQKRQEVRLLKSRGIGDAGEAVAPPRGFCAALTGYPGVSIIAEAKKASPSKGVIRPDFDPVKIAREYERGGAQALSVLTDEDFFQGSLRYLVAVRREVALPVIRKDFIIDPLQIEQASRFGADAILLIAAILDVPKMKDFRQQAEGLGMDVLVEVHDERELDMALEAGSRLIGVNNRDLRDFSVDLATTFRLQRLVPAGIPLVSESGIRDHADVKRLAEHKVCAALIGESLMRADNRVQALRELAGRAQET